MTDEELTPTEIIAAIAQAFALEPGELTGPHRHWHIAMARHVAMYAIRTRTSISFPKIGRQFGGRNHRSVMHGVRKVAALVEEKHPRVCAALHVLDMTAKTKEVA